MTRHLPNEVAEQLSSGLKEGGEPSLNIGDASFIDFTAGKGRLRDMTDPANPIITDISWDAQSVQGTLFGSTTVTHFIVDVNGDIQQTGSFDVQWPTADERRTYIYLGNGDHNLAQTEFISANNPQRSAYGLDGMLIADILESIGGIHSSGDLVTFNGANTKLDFASGVHIRYGGNMSDPTRPHTPNSGAVVAASFVESYMTSSGLSFAPTVTDVDTFNYQPLGNETTLEAIPSNKFVIRRIFRYGGTGPGGTGFNVVHHGNTAYLSLISARENVFTEPFREDSSLRPATFLGWLIHREGLTNFAQAKIDGNAQYLEWQGALRPPSFALN